MKIDKNGEYWINCRTQKEQEEVLDIFELIGAKWCTGDAPRRTSSYRAPMHYSVMNGSIRHGMAPVSEGDSFRYSYAIIEARDLHNQWISMKRGLDKRQDKH